VDTRCGREGEEPGRRPQAATAGRLAAAVFAELERLGPHLARPEGLQPFAVVAGDGRLVAANRPLCELLGCNGIMPTWESEPHPDRPQRLEATLLPPLRTDLRSLVPTHAWVHPVADADGVVAHTLLLTPHSDRPV